MPNLQHMDQPEEQTSATHDRNTRVEGSRMRRMPQNVPQHEGDGQPPAQHSRRANVRVRDLRQTVQEKYQPEGTPGSGAHRGEAVLVRVLWNGNELECEPVPTSEEPTSAGMDGGQAESG